MRNKSIGVCHWLYLPYRLHFQFLSVVLLKALSIGELNARRTEEDDLGRGSLFATGLIAGGAIAGVIVALLSINDNIFDAMKSVSVEESLTHVLGTNGYALLGAGFFVAMSLILYRIATKSSGVIR